MKWFQSSGSPVLGFGISEGGFSPLAHSFGALVLKPGKAVGAQGSSGLKAPVANSDSLVPCMPNDLIGTKLGRWPDLVVQASGAGDH